MQDSTKRVIVFIDYTNLYRRIDEIRKNEKINPRWPLYFDPRYLSKQLTKDRELTKVMFYCTKPPGKKLQGNKHEVECYHNQMRYIIKINGFSGFETKYGSLKGVPGNYREKGLDTQLSVDMVMMAVNDEYDTAILVSNDTDFVPAIKGIKQLGKNAELLFFKSHPCDELKTLCDVTIKAKLEYFRELPL